MSSYAGISIKEAMSKINTSWYLPAIQRPYVWGSRYDSEKYICKIFDSLYQSYPIGGLIMWETKSRVPFREFLRDYHQGDIYNNVDEGRWGEDKCLIYDGQQRLQTLYSCLKYTFNDRVQVFNLAYDSHNDDDLETGFRFINVNEEPLPFEIKMNRLFSASSSTEEKRKIRKEYMEKAKDEQTEERIEANLDQLWSVFVQTDIKSLAYFSIDSENEDKVNDIFERLNTGGVALSKADLLFSRIKAKYSDFESDIMVFCKQLATRTNIKLESYDILQLLHLIVRQRSRINEQVDNNTIDAFTKEWNLLQQPLNAFFDDYLRNHLHISHISIVRNKIPLLVLIVFFHEYYSAGYKYRDLSKDQLQLIDRFFIQAEINDWTLQSYSDNFTRIIQANTDKDKFPYEGLVAYVMDKGNRPLDIEERMFTSCRWMALKFLMPAREFAFDTAMTNRFNPELDHIFPVHLKGQNEDYRKYVDTVWNMQPVKGEVNLMKSNHDPLLFFTDNAKKKDGTPIRGSKYLGEYDFVPPLKSPLWHDYKAFIAHRRKEMIQFMKEHYGIEIKTE